MGEYLTFNTY